MQNNNLQYRYDIATLKFFNKITLFNLLVLNALCTF